MRPIARKKDDPLAIVLCGARGERPVAPIALSDVLLAQECVAPRGIGHAADTPAATAYVAQPVAYRVHNHVTRLVAIDQCEAIVSIGQIRIRVIRSVADLCASLGVRYDVHGARLEDSARGETIPVLEFAWLGY